MRDYVHDSNHGSWTVRATIAAGRAVETLSHIRMPRGNMDHNRPLVVRRAVERNCNDVPCADEFRYCWCHGEELIWVVAVVGEGVNLHSTIQSSEQALAPMSCGANQLLLVPEVAQTMTQTATVFVLVVQTNVKNVKRKGRATKELLQFRIRVQQGNQNARSGHCYTPTAVVVKNAEKQSHRDSLQH